MQDPVTRLQNVRTLQEAVHAQQMVSSLAVQLGEALSQEEKQRLAAEVAAPVEAHHRLAQAAGDVEQETAEAMAGLSRGEALEALADLVKGAHATYRRLLDRTRDPQMSELLVDLLRQATRQVAAVEALRRERP